MIEGRPVNGGPGPLEGTLARGARRSSPTWVVAALGLVVLAAVAVFSLGVMMGTRVAETVVPAAAPPAALPTESLSPVPPPASAATEAPVPPERMTFYDRLSSRAAPGPVVIPTGQSPTGQTPPHGAAAPSAAPAPSQSASVASSASAPAVGSPVARIRALMGKGNFAVQVAATNQRNAADGVAARFRKQGFDVVTVLAMVKGKTWYRVRVGSFPDQQAAEKAAALFRASLGTDGVAVHK